MTRNLEDENRKREMESRWFTKNKDTIVSRPYFFWFLRRQGSQQKFLLRNQRISLVSVPFMISLWCGNLNCIVPNLFDGFQQKGPRFGVEQFYKTDWFVKRWFCQVCNVFHIANLFYMVDNFMHKSNLFLIQRLVVNDCRIVIQLYHFSDQ